MLLLSLAAIIAVWNFVFCVIRPVWLMQIKKLEPETVRYISPIYVLSGVILLPAYFIQSALPEDPWVPLWTVGIILVIDPFGIVWTPLWILFAWIKGNFK